MIRSKLSTKVVLLGARNRVVHSCVRGIATGCRAILHPRIRLPGGVRTKYDLRLYLAG